MCLRLIEKLVLKKVWHLGMPVAVRWVKDEAKTHEIGARVEMGV